MLKLEDLRVRINGNTKYYSIDVNKKRYRINANSGKEKLDEFVNLINSLPVPPNPRAPQGHWKHIFNNEKVHEYAQGVWSSINQRTINGRYCNNKSIRSNPQQKSYLKNNIRLEMTQEEFYKFISNNSELVLKIYAEGGKPSIDRVDNSKGYSLDNIQIISLLDNINKRNITGGHNEQPVTKLYSKVRNRKQYIQNQESSSYDRLVIDKYYDVCSTYQIIEAIKSGLLSNAFDCEDGSPILDLPKMPRTSLFLDLPKSPTGRPITNQTNQKQRNQYLDRTKKDRLDTDRHNETKSILLDLKEAFEEFRKFLKEGVK